MAGRKFQRSVFTRPVSEVERDEQRERCFGMLKSKSKPRTEWQEHLDVVKFMRSSYPHIRFYSTFDGFYLGAQYAKAMPLRWVDTDVTLEEATKNGDGVPDLFIFHNNGVCSMLVIEMKRADVKPNRRDGTLKQSPHIKRQAAWLDYLANQGSASFFASGAAEAIRIIKQYIEHGNKGKSKIKKENRKQ